MPYDPRPSAKSCGIGAALLIVALMLVPTFSLADALKCKIEGYNEYFHHHFARHQSGRWAIRSDRHFSRHRQQSHSCCRPHGGCRIC